MIENCCLRSPKLCNSKISEQKVSLTAQTLPGLIYFTFPHVPDLLVDGVQLLLQHHGQCLGVRVAAGRQQVH